MLNITLAIMITFPGFIPEYIVAFIYPANNKMKLIRLFTNSDDLYLYYDTYALMTDRNNAYF
jgi:hypothetical protein